jgi:hypothetical protein
VFSKQQAILLTRPLRSGFLSRIQTSSMREEKLERKGRKDMLIVSGTKRTPPIIA